MATPSLVLVFVKKFLTLMNMCTVYLGFRGRYRTLKYQPLERERERFSTNIVLCIMRVRPIYSIGTGITTPKYLDLHVPRRLEIFKRREIDNFVKKIFLR
jgi:hypothetical protein